MMSGEPAATGEESSSAVAAKRRERALAFALLVICWLLLVWPSFSPELQFGIRDAGRFDWSLKRMIADEMHAGRLVSWNPYVALGESAVGTLNMAVFDPLNFLLLLAPFPWAFKGMFWACFALAGVGGALWLRGRGASLAAAVAGACVFMASGYLTGISNNLGFLRALSVVPLFLWLGDRYARQGGARALAAAGAAWAAVLYGGDPQSFGLCGLFLLALNAPEILRGPDRARKLRRFAMLGLTATAFAAPVLIPGISIYLGSDRSAGEFQRNAVTWSFPPHRLPELALPHIQDPSDEARAARPIYRWSMEEDAKGIPWVASEYVGIVAIALGLLGVGARTASATVIALLSLWLAAGPALGASQIGSFIPIWSGFQYSEKLLPWFVLAFCTLVAAGIDRISLRPLGRGGEAKPSAATTRLAASAIGIATASGGLALASALGAIAPGAWLADDPEIAVSLGENLTRGFAHVAVATAGLGVLCLAIRSGRVASLAASIALGALVVCDLLSANGIGVSLRDREMITTDGPIPRWLRENDPHARINTPFLFGTNVRDGDFAELPQIRFMAQSLAPSWNMYEQVKNFGWYGGMASTRYRVLREVGKADFAVYRTAPGLGAAYFVVPEDVGNLALLGIDPASATTVVHDPETRMRLVGAPGRPFAYMAEQVVAERDSAAVLRGILDPGFSRSPISFVEAPGDLVDTNACPSGVVPAHGIGVDRVPARIELELDVPCDGWLIVNETLGEGWRAEVDNEPAELFTANFLASGLPLQAGHHSVVLSYVPVGVREGVGIALAALLVLVLADRRERAA